MKTNKAALKTARRILQSTKENGVVNFDKIKSAVRLIGEKKPRNYQAILNALYRLVRLEVAGNKVSVQSAVPLGEESRLAVAGQLHAKYGEQIDIEYETNPDLLAGIRFQIGSNVIDGTLARKLEILKNNF